MTANSPYSEIWPRGRPEHSAPGNGLCRNIRVTASRPNKRLRQPFIVGADGRPPGDKRTNGRRAQGLVHLSKRCASSRSTALLRRSRNRLNFWALRPWIGYPIIFPNPIIPAWDGLPTPLRPPYRTVPIRRGEPRVRPFRKPCLGEKYLSPVR